MTFNKKLTGAALILSAALAIPALAFAQRGGGGPRKDADEVCKERMEKRAEMRKERLAEFDKDGDGKLDETERQTARAAREAEREARRLEHFDEMDADGDGVLTREEFLAAKPKHGRGGPRR